jgi:hypothetical protein
MKNMKHIKLFEIWKSINTDNFDDNNNKSKQILDKMHEDVIKSHKAQYIIRKFLFNEINKKKFIKLMMLYLKDKFDNIATDSEMIDIIYKFIEE